MAKGYRLEVAGIAEIAAKLDKLPDLTKKMVGAVIENGAKTFVRNAQRDAPKDTGFLTGQISYVKIEGGYQVVSGSFQAGLLEFGTKLRFTPIPGFEEEAASLKGAKGGNIDAFRDNIRQWVKRKGIQFTGKTPEQTADFIMYSILKNGIKPHPSFFPQVAPVTAQIQTQLKALKIDD